MALKAGTMTDFTNSMAAAMEQAFRSAWPTVKDTSLSSIGEIDRKLLFVAVAQGVVQHLADRVPGSFDITVRVHERTGDGWVTRVDTV